MRLIHQSVLAGGVLAALAAALAPSAQAQDKLRIGALVSATGGAAGIGTSYTAGIKMAQEEINKAGGIAGKQVEMVWGDTQSDPTQAVNEAKRLAFNEKVAAIIGLAVSQETIPLAPISNEGKFLLISTAGSPLLSPQAAPYHFSDSPSAAGQGIPMVNFALDELKAKKVAILSDNGGLSKAGVAAMTELLTKRGSPPVGTQEFPFHADDMTPQLLALRRAGADAILFMESTPEDAKKFIQNLADLGWDVPVVANATIPNYAPTLAKVLPANAFDHIYATAYAGYSVCPGAPLWESPFAQFVKRARADVPDLDKKGGPGGLGQAYTMVYIVKAAIEANGGKTDGPTLAAWIEANAAKIPNIVGPLQASNTDHFMVGETTMRIIAHPDKVREDGTSTRVKCP